MPDNAPATKRAATDGNGATIVEYDPGNEAREHVARELEMKSGYTMIPPLKSGKNSDAQQYFALGRQTAGASENGVRRHMYNRPGELATQ